MSPGNFCNKLLQIFVILICGVKLAHIPEITGEKNPASQGIRCANPSKVSLQWTFPNHPFPVWNNFFANIRIKFYQLMIYGYRCLNLSLLYLLFNLYKECSIAVYIFMSVLIVFCFLLRILTFRNFYQTTFQQIMNNTSESVFCSIFFLSLSISISRFPSISSSTSKIRCRCPR